MSDFINQIVDVAKTMMKDIDLWFGQNQATMPSKVRRDIVTQAFEKVAKKAGINESTVRDKCTRQLGINTDQFFNLISNYGATNGDTRLEDLLVEKRKKGDTEAEVRKAIRPIKANSTWKFTR